MHTCRLRFFGLCQGPGLHHEHFGVLILAAAARSSTVKLSTGPFRQSKPLDCLGGAIDPDPGHVHHLPRGQGLIVNALLSTPISAHRHIP